MSKFKKDWNDVTQIECDDALNLFIHVQIQEGLKLELYLKGNYPVYFFLSMSKFKKDWNKNEYKKFG